ncbi:hypothetical protein GGR21_002900 [Dysgonomonas hofstadii]|uniref:Peptidase M10 metallopeptidase domain-containing protein n=1 Tax=Dysgonomonas hofstadii TaxID=637886 RepID=A0A840CNL1_9BACT|nr:hypothetical protein [Dysgonomonas hofstadii]MBB4036986.1 hypothetical protein [Dysgonomonas hofstadii]
MKKFLQYGTLTLLLLLAASGLASFYYENAAIRSANDFNSEKFIESGFTIEELALFCDIAFADDGVRIRKWTKDIKVEIKNIGEIDKRAIDEVDSIISLLAPLIAPLKIERVRKDGNLHVYRNVTHVKSSKPHHVPKPKYVNGISKINSKSRFSWSIDFAIVYAGCGNQCQTLLHEFEHALGLDHPINMYSYYLTIGRSVIPQYFSSQEAIKDFLAQPYYLSEQEKKAIRMLYSPHIKAGLHIDNFARKMGFSDEDIRWMIPNKNKKQEVIVYPAYMEK